MEHQPVVHAKLADNARSGVAQNSFELRGGHAVIFAPWRGNLYEVKVDAADLESILAAGFWRVARFNNKSEKWYCYTIQSRKNVYLHRFLASPAEGFVVDHRNGDGLDNVRSNIRVATESLNQYNRIIAARKSLTGFRGVILRDNRWHARISHKNKSQHLGSFRSPVIAALRVQWELIDRGLGCFPKVHSNNVAYEVSNAL